MDGLRWTAICTALALFACTALSTFCFLLLLGIAKQNDAVYQNTEAVLEELSAQVDQIEAAVQSNEEKSEEDQNSAPPIEDSVESDVLYEQFVVRATNGRICVYTDEGYLIRTLDVYLETLPEADRESLERGIELYSWRELIALLQDYEG